MSTARFTDRFRVSTLSLALLAAMSTGTSVFAQSEDEAAAAFEEADNTTSNLSVEEQIEESNETAAPVDGYSNPAASGTQKTNYFDSELREFVQARSNIREVRDRYRQRIDEAGSDDEVKKLRREASEKMVEALDGTKLNVTTYNAIATAYNSEPQVRNRVDSLR